MNLKSIHAMRADGVPMAVHDEHLCRCDLEMRISAYGALADMFAGSHDHVAAAVDVLRSAKSSCPLAYFDDEALADLAREAVLDARSSAGIDAYLVERRRLIGDEVFDPFLNTVSPCGATYLTERPEDMLQDLRLQYQEAGYVLRFDVPCESHISVELDFMRFLLECVRANDENAAGAASRFFAEHLSGWSLLFAVAFGDAAKTSLARYAATNLDRFLSCEGAITRRSVPERCAQRRIASSS